MEKRFSGLKEYVYYEIKARFVNNTFTPGERIWEDKLAEELEVSRTPVREAINRLIAEGFVENRPRKGIYATDISKTELDKLLDIRLSLETLATKCCCKNIRQEQINELECIFQKYKKSIINNDFAKTSQLDSDIHRYIAQVADNKKLESY